MHTLSLNSCFLTGWAKMRSSLANHDPFNGSSTNKAHIAFSSIHKKMILKIPAAIRPINACSIAPDTFQ